MSVYQSIYLSPMYYLYLIHLYIILSVTKFYWLPKLKQWKVNIFQDIFIACCNPTYFACWINWSDNLLSETDFISQKN